MNIVIFLEKTIYCSWHIDCFADCQNKKKKDKSQRMTSKQTRGDIVIFIIAKLRKSTFKLKLNLICRYRYIDKRISSSAD